MISHTCTFSLCGDQVDVIHRRTKRTGAAGRSISAGLSAIHRERLHRLERAAIRRDLEFVRCAAQSPAAARWSLLLTIAFLPRSICSHSGLVFAGAFLGSLAVAYPERVRVAIGRVCDGISGMRTAGGKFRPGFAGGDGECLHGHVAIEPRVGRRFRQGAVEVPRPGEDSLELTCRLHACSGVIHGPPQFQPLQSIVLTPRPRRSASLRVCFHSSRHSGPRYVGPRSATPGPLRLYTVTPPIPWAFIASRSAVMLALSTWSPSQNHQVHIRAASGGLRKSLASLSSPADTTAGKRAKHKARLNRIGSLAFTLPVNKAWPD